MDIALMIDTQNGVTWRQWRHLLALAERLGFPRIYRSDHFFTGGQRESLECYLSLAIAATETQRIHFGPLVTPVTFRHPADVGRMAAQLDVLSGGRFILGLGAGWNEAEHRAYGLPFPGVKERIERLEETVEVIRALWSDGPRSYSGH